MASHVLHGFFKQHQIHDWVQLIVVLEGIHQCLLKLLQVSHLRVTRLTHTVSKMRVDQWLVDKNRLIYTLQKRMKREKKRANYFWQWVFHVLWNSWEVQLTSKYLLPVSNSILLKSSTSFSSISLSEYTRDDSWSHRCTRSIGYRTCSGRAKRIPYAHTIKEHRKEHVNPNKWQIYQQSIYSWSHNYWHLCDFFLFLF